MSVANNRLKSINGPKNNKCCANKYKMYCIVILVFRQKNKSKKTHNTKNSNCTQINNDGGAVAKKSCETVCCHLQYAQALTGGVLLKKFRGFVQASVVAAAAYTKARFRLKRRAQFFNKRKFVTKCCYYILTCIYVGTNLRKLRVYKRVDEFINSQFFLPVCKLVIMYLRVYKLVYEFINLSTVLHIRIFFRSTSLRKMRVYKLVLRVCIIRFLFGTSLRIMRVYKLTFMINASLYTRIYQTTSMYIFIFDKYKDTY